MKNLFSNIPKEILDQRKKTTQPDFIVPMLATLTKDYFSSEDWIYEHKFDGERCLVIKKNGKVHLLTRTRNEINAAYPELAKALAVDTADNFIIDGEIVAVNKENMSDFQLLQGRMNVRTNVESRAQKVPIFFCIFDIMYADGYDLRNLPLLARKEILKKLLTFNDLLTYTEHRSPDGIAYFEEACKSKWEGIIAKRALSTYAGARSRDWLKFKCIMKQELVIGGYTAPGGARSDFGALLVGYYKDKKLHYAGKVGTGFSDAILRMLGKKLKKLKTTYCPFVDFNGSATNITWVKPELVAEFQFAEWTHSGKLRVPRYKGLRDDKHAKDVVKEIPS